ncbi:hypothetical protein QC760_000942 [Botrytis cinerea]
MPPITRSKSPVKKTSADQDQASSASSISKNVAPVANMRSPGKKAPANSGQLPSGGNNALSDAMVPTLEPLSPSKRKRSAKTISGGEGVGEQPSEPMKRARVERSDSRRFNPASGQSDLAATTYYPQVERVVLGLEDTPVFGTAGGAPKEELDAGSSTSTPSPKPVESTAAAPVLVGEENGVTAKAPISAVTVTAGQADNESVVDQLTPHSAADLTGPLAATEAEVHLPAAPQDFSSSDLEVAKEELDPPKIGTTNTCRCDEIAIKFAEMKERIKAIEKQEAASRAENDKIRESMKGLLESNHKLRLERNNFIQLAEEHPRISQEVQRLTKLVRFLKDDNKQLNKRNDELVDSVNKHQINFNQIRTVAQKFKAEVQKLEDVVEGYRIAVNVLNKKVPEETQDQEDLELTRELLKIETAKNKLLSDSFQSMGRSFAAGGVVPGIETSDSAQGGVSHGNHGHEKRDQEGRSRRYRTPSPCSKGNNNYDVNDVNSDDDSSDSLPQLGAPEDVFTGTQQSGSASALVGFRGSYRWECSHDRGYNGNRCNHCGVHVLTNEDPGFVRERSVAPAASIDDLYGASDHGEERKPASPSYEPAEAVTNEAEAVTNEAEAVTNSQDESQPENSRYLSEKQDDEDDDERDESQYIGPTTLSGNEDYEDEEDDDQRDISGNNGIPDLPDYEDSEDDNQRDISGNNGIPDLPDYEDSEDDNQQDHQEFPYPAEAVEETFSAPPNVSSYFKPAHPGWGSPSVLLTQAAVTAPAPSTPSSVSEGAPVAPSLPTVITRSGAAVQFGAATTFGVRSSIGSSFRFGSTNSFGVPALLANSPSVVVSPEENDAEGNEPAGREK